MNGHIADQIAGVDHKQICKFENKYGGYGTIVDRLGKIRDSLMSYDRGGAMLDSEKVHAWFFNNPTYLLQDGVYSAKP